MIAKALKGISGLIRGVLLNAWMLVRRLASRKIVVFQLHAANQLPHLETVLAELSRSREHRQIDCFVLVHPSEFSATRSSLHNNKINAIVSSYYASPFLLFWDVVVTLDQRMHLPPLSISGGQRVCMFHGQPTKGNVYSGFNYQQIDGLFFYGPLMRDYYLAEKEQHPEWPDAAMWELGQPKTDALITSKVTTNEARSALQIDPSISTVVYAPSFESCASLATDGDEIIGSLIATGYNVIVKPHPSFYRVVNEQDEYFRGVPCASEWRDRATALSSSDRVIFPVDRQIDMNLALRAADILVTDHSGIAFDAAILDKALVFIDCPEFFARYLPERFGIDGAKARDDTTCNAGRSAGTTVNTNAELIAAVERYMSDPNLHATERKQLRDSLLFNQGCATMAYVEAISGLAGCKYD